MPKMQTHSFGDKSGSIDLPDGWTTASTSATFGIVVTGPAGQTVVFGNTQCIYTPDCRLVRNGQQTYQMQLANYERQLRAYEQPVRMHQQFPNTVVLAPPQKPNPPGADPNATWPQLTFCPECSGAEEVLKTFYPISEAKQRRAGAPYTTLDKIIEVVPAEGNSLIAGAKSGVAYLAVTDHHGEQTTHVRVLNRISTAPIVPNDCWQISFTNMRAPDATFDQDLPVMDAILNSVKLNMDVVNQQISDAGAKVRKAGAEAEQRLLAQGREFRKQQQDNFNRFEDRIAAQEQAVHDSASDFIEYIRGVREVVDSKTGETQDVSLTDSDKAVEQLNKMANDPDRFVQIPLRQQR